jgi:hypothetical protein
VTATESAYTQVVESQANQQQQIVHPFVPDDSQLSPSGVVSIPVGLTSKELAHLRSIGSGPGPTDGQAPPDSSSESAATIDRDAHVPVAVEATPLLPEAQRLWSEFDLLRHEVQQLQLRAERSEAPPTYASDEAGR